MIYTITGIHRGNPEWSSSDDDDYRCFGYFLSEEEALKAVAANSGSMNEAGFYQYLVVEMIGPGIHAIAKQIHWYRWVDKDEPPSRKSKGDYLQSRTGWMAIEEAPAELRNLSNLCCIG